MQDESLRRYERELQRAGFGTPREVAAALLRSTPARYWLVCGPNYPNPGALWRGSAWWPKEGPAGNANLPFPVTGWTFGGWVGQGVDRDPVRNYVPQHLIAYRVVGIEEAEALKAPFAARGWTLRLWDAVSQKQVTTYGSPTLDAVEEGWVSLADRPWDFAGPVSRGVRDEFLRTYQGLGLSVDPPLTVRIGDSTEALRVGSTPRERMDHFLRQSGVPLGPPQRTVLYPHPSTWALGQPSAEIQSRAPEPFVYLDAAGRLTLGTPISSDGLARDSSALALGRLQPDGSILLNRETPP